MFRADSAKVRSVAHAPFDHGASGECKCGTDHKTKQEFGKTAADAFYKRVVLHPCCRCTACACRPGGAAGTATAPMVAPAS